MTRAPLLRVHEIVKRTHVEPTCTPNRHMPTCPDCGLPYIPPYSCAYIRAHRAQRNMQPTPRRQRR